jgi:hypothetical protein
MTRINMFSVVKITEYWLILFKIEVKKTILFDHRHLDLYTLQYVVEFVIHAFFFIDEKVLLLPVVKV